MKNDWPETHLREWGAWYWKFLQKAYPSCTAEWRIVHAPGGCKMGSVEPAYVDTPRYIRKVHLVWKQADSITREAVWWGYVVQPDRAPNHAGLLPEKITMEERRELFEVSTGKGKSEYYRRIKEIKERINGKNGWIKN